MIEKQLKRAIWAMNEIIQASTRGITREELSNKWANSTSNDWTDKEIPERTFYRIRNMLQSVFDVDIECEFEEDYSCSYDEYDSSYYRELLEDAVHEMKDEAVKKLISEINEKIKASNKFKGLELVVNDVDDDKIFAYIEAKPDIDIVNLEKIINDVCADFSYEDEYSESFDIGRQYSGGYWDPPEYNSESVSVAISMYVVEDVKVVKSEI